MSCRDTTVVVIAPLLSFTTTVKITSMREDSHQRKLLGDTAL